MQLSPPEDQTPLPVRVKFLGHERRDFEDFLAYYESFFGTAIEKEELLMKLVSHAIRSDRDFLKWQRENSASDSESSGARKTST